MRKQHDKQEQPDKPKKPGKHKAYAEGEFSERDKRNDMAGDPSNPVA